MTLEAKQSLDVTEEPDRVSFGRWLAAQWRAFLMAVGFLTRFPVGSSIHLDVEAMRRCPMYFPLVGTLIGLMTAGIAVGGLWIWPFWLAVSVALAVELLVTGAFHEDAVADFFDAFGGGWTREDVLRILKDSRVGSYGVAGLVLALALRGGAMCALAFQHGLVGWYVWLAAVAASAAIGRWAIVLTMRWIPPVSERESLARDIGRQLSWRDVAVGTFWTLPAVAAFVWFLPVQSAMAVVMTVLVVWYFVRLVRRRIGGVTGDCLGCICYAGQIVVLLAAAAR